MCVVVSDSQIVTQCNAESGVDYPDKTECLSLQLPKSVHFNPAGKLFTANMSTIAILAHLGDA